MNTPSQNPGAKYQRLQLKPLSSIELYILLALSQSDNHAYDIAQSITIDSEDRFSPTFAGVSRALSRMTAHGWAEPAEPQAEKSPRRTPHQYRLTSWGRQQLSCELDRLNAAVELGRRRLTNRHKQNLFEML